MCWVDARRRRKRTLLQFVMLRIDGIATICCFRIISIVIFRIDGMEGSVHEAKPLRRGFLRKGGGRHDPDDAEVVVMIIEILYPLVMTKQTTQFLQCLSRCDICNPKTRWFCPILATTTV